MKIRLVVALGFGLLGMGRVASADETLPALKAGSEVYSNVTVTSVSATDVYFSFAGGLGSAKLKKLDSDLQKHFHFDATKAGEAEQKQRELNAQFHQEFAARNAAQVKQPGKPATETVPPPVTDETGDLIVPKLYARSVRGQRPPSIVVDQWLTSSPDVNGKFVLVDFWATWCGPCKRAIPHLNDMQAKFGDRLVVIGLSDESLEALQKLAAPKINYFVGTDLQARTLKALEVTGIPHAILIDPQGIVRFEGMPAYLDEKSLQHLLEKYAN